MSLRRVLAACILVWPLAAFAQSYPSTPIRLVVPFRPAGAIDILSRELARQLSDRLKQQVIVDNRPGAGGTLGSDIVAKSTADGYTIQMATSSTHSVGPSLNPKIPYNAQTDFTPVAHVANSVNVLLIAPNVKAANVNELTTLLKSKPAELERLRVLGYDAAGGTSADFAKVVAADTAKWAKLIMERKITIE